MGFKCLQDIHLLFSKMFFHPGGHHSPDAVMVAQGALVRLDPMDNPLLEFPEFRQVFHLCDKDKVQIGALAVEMGGMPNSPWQICRAARAAFSKSGNMNVNALEFSG
jgi:hypothetical protein